MKNRLILVLVLCFASLLFVSTSINKVESEENNVLKVSDDLEATLSKLSPNDTLLLWLDVNIPPLPDGNIYLSSSDLSPITDIGAKIAGVTFSPDKQLLWYLVETRPAQVSSLASLSMVRKISLAMIDAWDWWDKNWRNETPIDPLLNLTMQRVNRDFPSAKVPVVINYAKVERNKTKESRREIIGEITAFAQSVGGEVVRTGIAEYIMANVPPTALSRLPENKHVRTLEADKPAYLRGGSFGKSMSNSQSQLLLLLLPLCAVCYSMRARQKPRKVKLTLIISLLVTGFLLLYNVPSTYALDVSRPAIRADQAGYIGNGVVVAVIDSGIDFNHGDLVPAILADVDLTGHNDPMDYHGHGTHVAGIVASQSGTYTGIAPGSRIISLKIDTSARIQDAIQWCIDNRTIFNIRAIQLSWGDPTEQPGDGTDPLSMKADEAVEAGISVVVAVMDHDTNGNGIYELSNPEQAFNVIAVGAVNDQNTVDINDDTVAYYSAGNSTTDGRPKPDVVAPGGRTDDPLNGIWSTRSAQAPATNFEAVSGVYGRMSGTSMAAPHVSGTVALMFEANTNLTPAQVKAILRQTARLNNNLSGDERAGHGIIDAYEAVQLAQNVNGINSNLMYDSYHVETPWRHFGTLGWCVDYLKFIVDAPSSTFGVRISNVHYYFHDTFGAHFVFEHKLLHQISAPHVWIDGAYYNLGNDMHKYLFTGPRIYEKGDGYVRIRALYRINNVIIEYQFNMNVEGMELRLNYKGVSSCKTLIYIDPDVWDTSNYPYLPSTTEKIYFERKTSSISVNIRDADHDDYVEIQPQSSDQPAIWILRHGYFGNNPDTALNSEDVYNQNIVIYYQGTSPTTGPTIYRKTESLPTLPPSNPWTETPRDETLWACGYPPEPKSFIPAIIDWGQGWDTYIMYEPLFGTDVASGQLIKWLGEKIEWVNSTCIKVTLRKPGVPPYYDGIYWVKITDWDAWQAGTGYAEYYRPITTEDVKYSFQLYQQYQGLGDFLTHLEGNSWNSFIIENNQVFSVKIKPEHAWSQIVWQTLTSAYLIMPKDVWQQIETAYPWIPNFPNDWTNNTTPGTPPKWRIASGMYLPWKHQTAGSPQYTIMKKNWLWWGKAVLGRQPAPKYMGYLNYDSTEQLTQHLKEGNIDWCGTYVPDIGDIMQQYPFLHTYLEDPPYYLEGNWYIYSDLYWHRWPNELHAFLPCSPYGGSTQVANVQYILLCLGELVPPMKPGLTPAPTDLNNDCKVNIKDVSLAARAFGSYCGHPRWEFVADIMPEQGDGKVNILDIGRIALDFGTSNPPDPPDAPTIVSVYPSEIIAYKNETFSVDVKITNVTDMFGYQFELYYNTSVLNCTGVELPSGHFLEPSLNPNNIIVIKQEYDNAYNATHGRVWVAACLLGPEPSKNGSGTLATISFKATAKGTSTLDLQGTGLIDTSPKWITINVVDGTVTVLPPRYMRGDTHTVNNLTAYQLATDQSDVAKSSSNGYMGWSTVSWGIRVWVRHANGTETELTSGTSVAIVSRSLDGEGLQSNTWTCPETQLAVTDAIVVRVYIMVGPYPESGSRSFVTEQLGATKLEQATWTVYYYTKRVSTHGGPYCPPTTTGYFYWGTTTYNSHIQNIQYT